MAVSLNKGVFIVGGRRTPFGRFGGRLREMPAADLFAAAAREALTAAGLSPRSVDTVNIGQTSSLSVCGMSPRHAALKAGVPHSKPVLALNKLSGSGFHAIVVSAQEILTSSSHISLAGGMENLSSIPFLVRGARFGIPPCSSLVLEDWLRCSNYDSYCSSPLLQLADVLADKYKIRRVEVDEFAVDSQKKWKAAYDRGLFHLEVVPVKVAIREQEEVMSTDENPRPNETVDSLSRWPSLFEGGITTAANVSSSSDGAAAVILTSEAALTSHGLPPLARLVGWASVGVEPALMGIGAMVATQRLLEATGLTMDDVDLIEIHETFAAQALVSARGLGVDSKRLNVNGGGIAIGHPAGATGARVALHLTLELRRRQLRRGIGAVCVAGGQGMALLIEAIH